MFGKKPASPIAMKWKHLALLLFISYDSNHSFQSALDFELIQQPAAA
jgi:hypothetical protein